MFQTYLFGRLQLESNVNCPGRFSKFATSIIQNDHHVSSYAGEDFVTQSNFSGSVENWLEDFRNGTFEVGSMTFLGIFEIGFVY